MIKKVAILGGGAAGLAAGHNLLKANIEFTLFEKEDYYGGLARSFQWHGFDCDFAAHRFFTNDEEVKKEALQLVPMLRHYRRSKLYVKGHWLNDPINPAELARVIPLREALKMAAELARPTRNQDQARNFKEYVVGKYGGYMYEAFFRPYTEKMFGIQSEELSVLWAQKKTRLINPFKKVDGGSKRYFAHFYYPLSGGYGSISDRLYQPIASHVKLHSPVTSILTENGQVRGVEYLKDDRPQAFDCDTIISTLPLPVSARLLGLRSDLSFQKVDAIYIWVNKAYASPNHWVYFIDESVCINRMVEFKHMSPYNCPEQTTVLCAEVTQDVPDPAARVVADLIRTGFIEEGSVLDTKVVREPYSYPLYSVGYDDVVKETSAQLRQFTGFHLFGRAAEFEHYEVDDLIGGAGKLVRTLATREGQEQMATTPEQAQKEKICVVLLSFNNQADTLECLASLKALDGGPYHTYLVDNGSTDGTITGVGVQYPEVEILAQPTNLGVPRGFNKGVYQALVDGYDYILLLNNDTVANPTMVEELLAVLKADPDRAVAMPCIYYYPPRPLPLGRQEVWADGGYYRKFPPAIKLKDDRKSIDFSRPRQVEYVPTCGLLFHRRAFENVGLFDEGYFLFYEDWDFSERLRDAGLTIWSVPTAVLWHKVSRSTKKNLSFYWQKRGESAMRFFRRHHRPLSTALQMGYFFLRDFVLHPANLKYLKDYRHGIQAGKATTLEKFPDLASMLRKNSEN